jgi:putative ABC transport system ATP-binding protein
LNPKFIIADEPTGNLDVKTGDYLMGLIQDFNEQFGVSVLVVTHNEDQVKYAKRVIRMLDGQVISNEIREK